MYKKVKFSDYAFHPSVGTNFPGKEEANPYMSYPPYDLRDLLNKVKDEEELKKIISALKQWERQYQYPGYPWRVFSSRLRFIASKMAELDPPAQNVPYYQDTEVPSGFEEILDSLQGLYDNDNNVKPSIKGPAERPVKDVDFFMGDLLTPKDPVFDAVSPRGDGKDPEGMDTDVPVGTDSGEYQQGIWS